MVTLAGGEVTGQVDFDSHTSDVVGHVVRLINEVTPGERHGRALIFKAIFRLDEWVRPGFRKSGIEMSAIPERERKVKPWSRALSAR